MAWNRGPDSAFDGDRGWVNVRSKGFTNVLVTSPRDKKHVHKDGTPNPAPRGSSRTRK